MFHTVTQEQFKTIKARQAHCRDADIDTRVLGIVKAFQQFPGIATVWSCSGHTREEYAQRDEELGLDKDKMYIAFVTDGSCSILFEVLSDFFSGFSHEKFHIFRPEINAVELLWGFGGELNPSLPRYKCWSLNLPFKNTKQHHALLVDIQTKLLDVLQTKLKELTP